MKTSTSLLCITPLVLAFSGCAFFGGPGAQPSDTPPRLISDGGSGSMWDNTRFFGPVPPEMQARGDAVCKKIGFAKANGYHPKAEDIKGRAFTGGGFLCSGKSE